MTYTKWVWIKFGIVVIGFALVFSVSLIFEAFYFKNAPENIKPILILVLVCVMIGFFSNWLFRKIDDRWATPAFDRLIKEVNQAELGDEGEDGVCYELEKILSKNSYAIKRNFKIPKKRYDFDAIVVGPKGIIVLEIKNHTNPMLFANDAAYVEKAGRLIEISHTDDPRRSVISYCRDLEKYLFQKGLGRLPVHRAVVFYKKDGARIIGDKTGVYVVCGVQDLNGYISRLPADSRFTPKFCEKINTALNR